MFTIPSENKKFKVSNESDRLGNVFYTKNINFSDKGYFKLAPKAVSLTDDTVLTDFSYATGYGVSKIIDRPSISERYFLGTKNVYLSSYITPDTFTKDTATSFPTLSSSGANDAEYYPASTRMYVCNGTSLYYRTSSTYSTVSVTVSPVTLCLFKNLNYLAVGGNNQVELIDATNTSVIILELPIQYSVTKMAWANERLYIATQTSCGNASLFEWDGLSADANDSHEVLGHTIYSVVPYKDGVACVTSEGELLYNRSGWELLDRFPIYFKDELWQDSPTSNLSRKIPAHAMDVDKDTIYIGVNNRIDSNGNRDNPRRYSDFISGVWCYEPETGLQQKYTCDGAIRLKTNTIATTSVDTSTNIITVSGVTVPATGTPVMYFSTIDTSGTKIGGLENVTTYYTIYQSGTTLKLATTYDNAINGVAIDLTGTGNNSQYLIFYPLNQIGSTSSRITAICVLNRDLQNLVSKQQFGKILIGGTTFTNSTTEISFIASVLKDVENRAYLVSPKLESENIKDTFRHAVLRFKPLETNQDKIVIKYRTKPNTFRDYESYNSVNLYTNLWVDGNTYTTTENISNIKAGDEIEVMSSNGSGYTAHITSLSENAGTWTVNIDETVPNVTAGDKLQVVYSNWKKISTITKNDPDNQEGYKEVPLGFKSKFIQFKIELRGNNIKCEDFYVDNTKYLSF